jgi:hypothetical protein
LAEIPKYVPKPLSAPILEQKKQLELENILLIEMEQLGTLHLDHKRTNRTTEPKETGHF